jgi:hypothetical protein
VLCIVEVGLLRGIVEWSGMWAVGGGVSISMCGLPAVKHTVNCGEWSVCGGCLSAWVCCSWVARGFGEVRFHINTEKHAVMAGIDAQLLSSCFVVLTTPKKTFAQCLRYALAHGHYGNGGRPGTAVICTTQLPLKLHEFSSCSAFSITELFYVFYSHIECEMLPMTPPRRVKPLPRRQQAQQADISRHGAFRAVKYTFVFIWYDSLVRHFSSIYFQQNMLKTLQACCGGRA